MTDSKYISSLSAQTNTSSTAMKAEADTKSSLCAMLHFMWIYVDVHAFGLILYYEELYFNYTHPESVGQ